MTFRIGFSTCPNDTFIFDALVNKRIACGELYFEPFLADVEELNKLAFQHQLDITKISIAAYPGVSEHYVLLDSGGAIGKNNGPLLVSKHPVDLDKINTLTIAIPGMHTTANLLFSIAFPNALRKKEYLFSKIEDAVLDGHAAAGLLIHESRFTYQSKGLQKVVDFGEFWENEYHQPIPLGGIAIRRNIPVDFIYKVNHLISESVKFAFADPKASDKYVKLHAQELEDEVIRQHIQLYVNQYSANLGQDGRSAIRFLFEKGAKLGLLPKIEKEIFVI
jgi:1,4-dihydroxy-6-naphthoate synthase